MADLVFVSDCSATGCDLPPAQLLFFWHRWFASTSFVCVSRRSSTPFSYRCRSHHSSCWRPADRPPTKSSETTRRRAKPEETTGRRTPSLPLLAASYLSIKLDHTIRRTAPSLSSSISDALELVSAFRCRATAAAVAAPGACFAARRAWQFITDNASDRCSALTHCRLHSGATTTRQEGQLPSGAKQGWARDVKARDRDETETRRL